MQRSFTQDRRHLPLAETTGNGSTVSFAYDDFGRITSRTVDSDPDKVVSYSYGKDGRLEKTANTMCTTGKRGCIICGAGIMMPIDADSSAVTAYWGRREICCSIICSAIVGIV